MTSPAAALPAKRRNTRNYIRRYWPLYSMLLLPVGFCLLFKYWPMTGLVMAFKDFGMMEGIWGSPWNGVENFRYLFSRADSVNVILQTLKLNVLDLVFGFPMPIILAIMLNEVSGKSFKRVTQTVIYLPHFLSWVIIASLFITMLRTETGMINTISALATAMIMGIITNLLVNNGKMSSGEDNMVSGHAENMGNVKDPEKK